MLQASSSLIEVNDLSVVFRGVPLLQNVNFTIRAGEVLVLLGVSGAGKSLLIDAIAGNIPHGGEVLFNSGLGRSDRTFSYDGFATLSLLHVDEVLKLVERIYGAPRNEAMIDRFKIGSLLKKPVRVLSKGERKRVGVYTALFSEPSLAVLDEPTDGMDPMLREAFWEVVRERTGATFLTTHMWSEAVELHDRVALLARGRLLAAPAPVSELMRLVPYCGKVVVDEGLEFPDHVACVVNDKRRFLYFSDEAEKKDLVKRVSASATGYSVLPVDLIDLYLLLERDMSENHS
jgi:ABC-2 type transport system ATP-binding protein